MSALRHLSLTLAAALVLAPSLLRAQPGSFEGGITGVSLHPHGDDAKDDQTLSADLFARRPTARGEWLVYVEGNSSLDIAAASSVFVEANADAGTALDP
ncbi:MAG TPA: hypothetical protein VLD39_06205 [Gammaproteobacteria bacterium]|nr:hypothetical protein [Gammaproteobacteria bacterium]